MSEESTRAMRAARTSRSFADRFPGFRLHPTRWGVVFLAGLVVLGFAAVNTGNNALMALLGVALGSYAVSGAWSREVLAAVTAQVTAPSEVYAGRPAVLEVELVNTSRWLPAYGLVVLDAGGTVLVRQPLLPAVSSRRHAVELEFERRGWNAVGPWRLEVLLPLGFFVKSKLLLASRQLLVYPRLLETSTVPRRAGGGTRSAESFDDRGREGDVMQLRDYLEGDDRRQLHWKQSARQQRLIVVDRQRRSEQPLYLVLDARVSDPTDEEILRRFERLVSDVATGVVRRLETGRPVALVVDQTVVPPIRSAARAARLLRPLAEVQARPPGGDPPARAGSHPAVLLRLEAGA